jgi:hypothetical protein
LVDYILKKILSFIESKTSVPVAIVCVVVLSVVIFDYCNGLLVKVIVHAYGIILIFVLFILTALISKKSRDFALKEYEEQEYVDIVYTISHENFVIEIIEEKWRCRYGFLPLCKINFINKLDDVINDAIVLITIYRKDTQVFQQPFVVNELESGERKSFTTEKIFPSYWTECRAKVTMSELGVMKVRGPQQFHLYSNYILQRRKEEQRWARNIVNKCLILAKFHLDRHVYFSPFHQMNAQDKRELNKDFLSRIISAIIIVIILVFIAISVGLLVSTIVDGLVEFLKIHIAYFKGAV